MALILTQIIADTVLAVGTCWLVALSGIAVMDRSLAAQGFILRHYNTDIGVGFLISGILLIALGIIGDVFSIDVFSLAMFFANAILMTLVHDIKNGKQSEISKLLNSSDRH